MTPEIAIDLAREAVLIALVVGMPIMLVAVVIGLIISIGQAVTQLQEQTLSFVPKIAAMFLVAVLLTPWLIDQMTDYATALYEDIPTRLLDGN